MFGSDNRDSVPDCSGTTICLGQQSLVSSSGTPVLNGSGLALGKDLAVSFPLLIPMAELGLLAWDGAFLPVSGQNVSARTSVLLLGAVSSYLFISKGLPVQAGESVPNFLTHSCE